jgi:hypothetical protein
MAIGRPQDVLHAVLDIMGLTSDRRIGTARVQSVQQEIIAPTPRLRTQSLVRVTTIVYRAPLRTVHVRHYMNQSLDNRYGTEPLDLLVLHLFSSFAHQTWDFICSFLE